MVAVPPTKECPRAYLVRKDFHPYASCSAHSQCLTPLRVVLSSSFISSLMLPALRWRRAFLEFFQPLPSNAPLSHSNLPPTSTFCCLGSIKGVYILGKSSCQESSNAVAAPWPRKGEPHLWIHSLPLKSDRTSAYFWCFFCCCYTWSTSTLVVLAH